MLSDIASFFFNTIITFSLTSLTDHIALCQLISSDFRKRRHPLLKRITHMQLLWQTTRPTLRKTQLCPLSQRAPQWSPVKLSQRLTKHRRPSTASVRLTVCPASSFQCFLAVLTWFIGPRISTESLVVRTWCPPNEPLAIVLQSFLYYKTIIAAFVQIILTCLYGSILK